MPSKVLVLDTSVLCCWLRIPGKETAGPVGDLWDYKRISTLLTGEEAAGSVFVLPLASLIETGNHIAQAPDKRYDIACELAVYLKKAATATSPWAVFTEQAELWGVENLQLLADTWPKLAAAKVTIGDATIKNVAEFYAKAGSHVEILTGDEGLKAYQPAQQIVAPRRRS